jgi:sulfonate transport system permease protein
MPFAIALVGIGDPYKIAMVAAATFFVMHGHAFDGGNAVLDSYLELARIYQKPFHARITRIILPAASPLIFAGLRLSLALAWVILMFVEFGSAHSGSEGLGWFVADARALGKVEEEYAGVAAIAILGLMTDALAAASCAYVSRWSVESGAI